MATKAIVRLLPEHGVDPSPADICQWSNIPEGFLALEAYDSPMALAAGQGHESIVKLLLTYGAAVDTPTSDDKTPLMSAAQAGHLSVVKVLVSAGSDLSYCSEDFETAISCAVAAGHVDVVRYSPETGVDLEAAAYDHESLLCHAAKSGNIRMVILLLKYGVDAAPNLGDRTIKALAVAAQLEHHTMARIIRDTMNMADLLSSGVPTDDNHKTLLLVSAACGWEELVLQLLRWREILIT